jgi:hypothetical protein
VSTHQSPKNVKEIPMSHINKQATVQPIHKYEISTEILSAVSESQKTPFHPTADSPCMQMLMDVKKDYLLKTGKIKELNALNSSGNQPVLTKVSGVGMYIYIYMCMLCAYVLTCIYTYTLVFSYTYMRIYKLM